MTRLKFIIPPDHGTMLLANTIVSRYETNRANQSNLSNWIISFGVKRAGSEDTYILVWTKTKNQKAGCVCPPSTPKERKQEWGPKSPCKSVGGSIPTKWEGPKQGHTQLESHKSRKLCILKLWGPGLVSKGASRGQWFFHLAYYLWLIIANNIIDNDYTRIQLQLKDQLPLSPKKQMSCRISRWGKEAMSGS